MRHTLVPNDLNGVFETILASSSKDGKRLIIQTDINDGQADTFFVVLKKGERGISFKTLLPAINKYNLI